MEPEFRLKNREWNVNPNDLFAKFKLIKPEEYKLLEMDRSQIEKQSKSKKKQPDKKQKPLQAFSISPPPESQMQR